MDRETVASLDDLMTVEETEAGTTLGNGGRSGTINA